MVNIKKEELEELKRQEKQNKILIRQIGEMESYTLDLLNTCVELVEGERLPFPFHNYRDVRKSREKMFRVLARKVSKAPKFIVIREGVDF